MTTYWLTDSHFWNKVHQLLTKMSSYQCGPLMYTKTKVILRLYMLITLLVQCVSSCHLLDWLDSLTFLTYYFNHMWWWTRLTHCNFLTDNACLRKFIVHFRNAITRLHTPPTIQCVQKHETPGYRLNLTNRSRVIISPAVFGNMLSWVNILPRWTRASAALSFC